MSIDYDLYHFKTHSLLARLEQAMMPWAGIERVDTWLRQTRERQRHIALRRFRVAVVGEFKRGKSSLINALLENKILPADVLPTTATFNRIVYGETPRAYLLMKDNTREEVPIDELDMYITKLNETARERAEQIREAVIEYPSMFCRNGVELIDTPGLNDDAAMTSVTLNRLEQIDLAIVAVSALYPLSETETGLVVQLLETPSVCQILIAVTMIDQIDEEERERLMVMLRTRLHKKVLERLQARHEPDDPVMTKYTEIFSAFKMYGISSTEAIRALETHDIALLRRSGYERFARELPSLLLAAQGTPLVLNTLRQCVEHIDDYLRWFSGYGGELDAQRERIIKLKNSFGAATYAAMREEQSAWDAALDAQFRHSIEMLNDEIANEFRNVWTQTSCERRERVLALLRLLPSVFLMADEWAERLGRTDVRGILSRASVPPTEALTEKLREMLSEFPQLALAMREDIDSLHILDAELDDRPPFVTPVVFRWVTSPIPLDAEDVDDAYLAKVIAAVSESASRCYADCARELRALVAALKEKRTQRFQKTVMAFFRLAAEYDDTLARKRSLIATPETIEPMVRLRQEFSALHAQFMAETSDAV